MSSFDAEMTQQIMNRVLFAAEQHLDYMNRSIASESGRYTQGERDLLINDVFAMRSVITEAGETSE
jgi:hypothetical protein